MKITKYVLSLILITGLYYAQSENGLFNQDKSSLLSASQISITIGGDFIVNGSFSAIRSQRVDHFLTQIFLEAKQQATRITSQFEYAYKILKQTEDYPRRNILLKHADGTEELLDLEKFRILGDFKENPYLKNDDVIIFPSYDIEKDFVLIDGAVNKPGKIQFVDEDKLSDILLLAQGVSKAYENVKTAKISRLSYNGKEEEVIDVELSDDIKLQRGDRIVVVAEEPFRRDFKVNVIGEVNMPGEIYITNNNTRLVNVIENAGGLTDKAWLKKIKIIRGPQKNLYEEDKILSEFYFKEYSSKLHWFELELGRMSNLTLEDTITFKVDSELKFINEVGNIDFSELFTESSEANKFVVKDGDVILIPEFKNRVYVFGQVGFVGEYDFVEGEDHHYYINKAGGLGEYAEEDKTILIKGDNGKWISFEENENIFIEPGDFIWIPKKIQYSSAYYWDKASKIATIVGSVLGPLITIILVLTN